MLRFPNCGSSIETQVAILKELYKKFPQNPINLSDIVDATTCVGLMTSQGYAGTKAKLRNAGKITSKKGTDMNAKLYAEIFRMLGWLTPVGEKSYPVMFTFIGRHLVCLDKPEPLIQECVFGINNPNALTNNMRYFESVRFFKVMLRMMKDLGGVMYWKEMCIGPMSISRDISEENYKKTIKQIRKLRGTTQQLNKEFANLCNKMGIQENTAKNYTRFPISVLKYLKYITMSDVESIYEKKLKCMILTDEGENAYKRYSNMVDIRLNDYDDSHESIQSALIRLGMYSMLQRAGFDITTVLDSITKDKKTCSKLLHGKEILFSPYQTIKRKAIEQALELSVDLVEPERHLYDNRAEKKFDAFKEEKYINSLDISCNGCLNMDYMDKPQDREFLRNVQKYVENKKSKSEIIDILYKKYMTADETVFYPLVATLFKILGFNCITSRRGTNALRFDVVIKDSKRSIPIEVKSATETPVVNAKAVKQALENKIVMLSRGFYKTDKKTTSIALGYRLPNERADIQNMIEAFKNTYDFNISVLGFEDLLKMAISLLIDGKTIMKEDIYSMRGVNDVNV